MVNQWVFLAALFLVSSSALYADGEKGEHIHSQGESNHSHEAQSHKDMAQPTVKMTIVNIEDKGDKKLVKIKLSRIDDDSPVNASDLKVVHTEKVHLLIIDDGLEDYHHIHPKVDSESGIYTFEWAPKKTGNYRMWADLHPLTTDDQEYVIADLTTDQNPAAIDKTASSEATVDNYKFNLSFDEKELKAGKAVMGRISITNDKGQPVKDLEPIMGAFAHIVGFGDDFKSIVHIHPMGTEPSNPSDRGGPELQFHLQPEKPGFIKLFAQVKINGKEIFAPFGINVI